MKSAWVISKGKIEMRVEEYEKPKKDEVVVKIRACGICGTDLHFFNDFPAERPMPLGHEVSGTIHETGREVQGLSPGDSVVVQNHVPCGKCESCRNGNASLCRNIQTYMSDRAGMAEYLKVNQNMIIPYRGLSHEEAVIAEPLTVALDLMRESAIEPLNNVIISGPGIIGLFCTALARLYGAGTIVVLGRKGDTERGKKRISEAKRMGANLVFDTEVHGWVDRLQKKAPEVIDRIIVTSPPNTIPRLLHLASFGAWIIYNGISFREETISFNANDFHFKKLRLIASHAIPNWGFPVALRLLGQNQFGHKRLITHRYPFERLGEALYAAQSSHEPVIKVVVTFPA